MSSLVSRRLPLACVAILILNDHVLKAAMPGFITGKLSDFAGLFFFPLLLADVLAFVLRTDARRFVLGTCIATAVTFAATKTWGPANELYSVGLGALQWPFRALAHGSLPSLERVELMMDPTDLVALVAVVAASVYTSGRASRDLERERSSSALAAAR